MRKLLFLLTILFCVNTHNVIAQDNNVEEKVSKKQESKKGKASIIKNNENVVVADVLDESDSKFNLKPKKILRKATEFNQNGNHYEAIDYYKAALSKSSRNKLNRKLNHLVANTYFDVKDYKKSAYHYNKSINLDSKNKFYFNYYNYANSLKYLGEYKEAKSAYREFLTFSENKKEADIERSKTYLEIRGCNYALDSSSLMNTDFAIKNAGNDVNGLYNDFGPELRGNELVLSKILDEWKADDTKNRFLSQVYSSEMYDDQYNFAQKFSSSVNDINMSVSNPSFSVNGEEVYFTKCSFENNKETNCAIYYSRLENGIWIEATKLNANINEENANTNYPQIVIDENGNEILYFSAERERGRGGSDIYYAEKLEDGSFSRARNIGYPINTRFDDVSPFYHTPTKTLYLSTNGKISLGGLDIYKSIKDNDEFQEPEHLAYPFNTSLDDYGLIFNDKVTLGFLASNRKGTYTEKSEFCCTDIFELKTTKINVFVKGLIYLEKDGSREVINKAQVELFDNKGDGELVKSDDGTFLFQLDLNKEYKILANSEGFDEGEILFNTKNITKSDTLQYDLFLDNIITEDPFNLSTPKEEVTHNAFNKEIIGVIYYGFSTSNLTEEAPEVLAEILKYLNDNPKVIVEISSHTDDKGPTDFNLQLSKDRCLAAANYLESNGIKPSRILKRWYGETQPIAPNQYDDGSDYEEGRERNRRTEFKAFGEL